MSSVEDTSGGRVIWITGLSGSGKTTLARALQKELPHSVLLDGDDLREALGQANSGFDAESRKKLAFSYSSLSRLIALQGFTVLVATISLFHDLHAWNRENLPNYFEIFLDVPEEKRRSRDPKGLYAENVPSMAGIQIRAEFPLNPHLRFFGSEDLAEVVKDVLRNI